METEPGFEIFFPYGIDDKGMTFIARFAHCRVCKIHSGFPIMVPAIAVDGRRMQCDMPCPQCGENADLDAYEDIEDNS